MLDDAESVGAVQRLDQSDAGNSFRQVAQSLTRISPPDSVEKAFALSIEGCPDRESPPSRPVVRVERVRVVRRPAQDHDDTAQEKRKNTFALNYNTGRSDISHLDVRKFKVSDFASSFLMWAIFAWLLCITVIGIAAPIAAVCFVVSPETGHRFLLDHRTFSSISLAAIGLNYALMFAALVGPLVFAIHENKSHASSALWLVVFHAAILMGSGLRFLFAGIPIADAAGLALFCCLSIVTGLVFLLLVLLLCIVPTNY